jgi:hypothetical protein
MSVSAIVTGLKSVIETTLTSFEELNFAVETQDNPRRTSENRYAVLPLGINEVEGRNLEVTVDQTFKIKFTNNYNRNSTNDTSKQSVINSLLDNMLTVYAAIVKGKAGAPSSVMNVYNMSVENPIDMKENELIILEMSFLIRHRQSLQEGLNE